MSLHVHLVPSLAGVDVGAAVTVDGPRRTMRSPYVGSRSASRCCSPTAWARSRSAR